MADELDFIVDAAKKASKGEWYAIGWQVETDNYVWADPCNCNTVGNTEITKEVDKKICANAIYIASVQPKNILPIIAELRALRRILAKVN